MFGFSWARILIALAIAGLLATAWLGWLGVHDAGVAGAATTAERNAWLERDARDAEASAKETQRRLERQGDSNRETEKRIAVARAAADRAAAAAGQLRRDLAAADEARRRGNPAAVTVCAPAETALDLRTDMLGRIDAAAGELAGYATAARIAGEACEREHDALTGATP